MDRHLSFINILGRNNSRPDGPTLIFYISCDENNSRPDGPTLIFYISCDENNCRPDGPTLVFYISWDENNSRPDGPILIFYKYPVTKTTLGQMDRHLSFINILGRKQL